MPLVQVSGHTFMRQLVSDRSVVLDLGANTGNFSRTMIDLFGCRCIAVEANPSLCADIAAGPRLLPLNKAVAGDSSPVSFFIYDRAESSSLIQRSDRGPAREVRVPATTIAELVADCGDTGVDLLKIDIEGAEVAALDACPDDTIRGLRQVCIEFHDFNGLVAKQDVLRVVERFQRLGFHVMNMWKSTHGDTLFINRALMPAASPDLLWSRHWVRHWWWSKRLAIKMRGDTPPDMGR
jgi:FkbM family methyltransferase